ncbi:MAG: diaminopimelate decarboxylase [Actinomycetes bacterium]
MAFAPEIFSENSKFDSHLSIAGVSAEALIQEFGSPLFVVDESDFKARALTFKTALDKHFGNQAGSVYYASKAFLNKEIARWIESVGIGIDVASGGELAVALAVNFPPERIQVHGNNKSEAEIEKAIVAGVGAIVIDSFHEIERVARIAAAHEKIQNVFIRVTPGIEAHTHEFIATAHEDVKFGFSLASGSAWKAIEEIEALKSLKLVGLHSHIGSQIFDALGFGVAAERVISLLAKFRDHYSDELPELDLGGGYGVAYLPGEESVNIDSVLAQLSSIVIRECASVGIRVPRISIEPGRAIAAPTTTTLYTVGTTKSIELDGGDTRRYIAVDGGFTDNMRPALYDAKYHAILANRLSSSHDVLSRVVGKHCESGDIIIRDIQLPQDIVPGDILAVPVTGAYGRQMASNYNHLTRPAVIAVIDGKARLIVRRETEADLLALDI